MDQVMDYTEPACAKLNLTLDILGKRPDGYHEMRMVMQSIDLADEVNISGSPEPGFHVSADLPYLPRGEGNIAHKAASRFFEQTGLPRRSRKAKKIWKTLFKTGKHRPYWYYQIQSGRCFL